MTRSELFVVASMVVACKAEDAKAPTQPTVVLGLARASSTVEVPAKVATPLGTARTARIQTAYASLRPAFADWNLGSYGRDCLLMFNEQEEWLVGCSGMEGTSGFVATGQVEDGVPVLWNPKSLMASDKYLPYEQVKLGLVGTVGTHAQGSGEKLPVVIVQEWDALHRNHPGFQASYMDEWLGVFVHEAFHARQMWHPHVKNITERWSAEKPPVTADELASFYKSDASFRTAIAKEVEVLRGATEDASLNASKARTALTQWLKLYQQREAAFAPTMEKAFPGKSAWLMDAFETFLEGSARYVEARFLISPPERSFELLKGELTFHQFEQTKGKRPSQLPGLGNVGARYFYALGMYLCFVLDVAEPTWKSKVFDSERLLIGEVERFASGKP